jgi:hypothetical protein
MPQWLAAAGLGAPRAAEVNADLGYASWWVMFCCCTDRGIWLGTLLSRVMPCLRAVVHSVVSSRAQGYPLAVHSQRLFFGGSGGPLGPVSTVCHRLYPMQEAKCFFSLNGLCPCGASVEGREFGHFAATHGVISCDKNNNLGVCVKWDRPRRPDRERGQWEQSYGVTGYGRSPEEWLSFMLLGKVSCK